VLFSFIGCVFLLKGVRVEVLELETKVLHSVFQPIYSFSNQACIGVEALVRGRSIETGSEIPVYECLEEPQGMSKTEFARQLNRIHLLNWQHSEAADNWVFINLDFQSVSALDDFCLEDLISSLALNGRQIVVEVVESEIQDEKLFEKLIAKLRSFGCFIALDDFGAGHSNIDRIWKVEPDIVKLDRQVLLEASKSIRSQSILRNLTRLIQQSGSICLLEGIETKEQAMLAMDVGVDLVQGFYFAKPSAEFDSVSEGELV